MFAISITSKDYQGYEQSLWHLYLSFRTAFVIYVAISTSTKPEYIHLDYWDTVVGKPAATVITSSPG